MSRSSPTYIGDVASVSGSVVRVRLRSDRTSSVVLVDGSSYRVGQIGAFLRLPLGHTHLYAICTQVGAEAIPTNVSETAGSWGWMSVVLFGEAIGGIFERGVGQYPTVGDQVHLVTEEDLSLIHGSRGGGTITIGHVSNSRSVPALLSLAPLVSRHTAIVGSTGVGKSNSVAVLLEAIATQGYPSARVLVIDPHGEYATLPGAEVFKVNPDTERGEKRLVVPFWALPFEELAELTLGGLQPQREAQVRDEVLALKRSAATLLTSPPPAESVTSDSPIPFSVKKLWFDLDDFERQTFEMKNDPSTRNQVTQPGSAEELRSNAYPPATSNNSAPFLNPRGRKISRQLEFMRSRLLDTRFQFLFDPGKDYSPDLDGKVEADLDSLVQSWVGHDKQITVLDVSGLPAETLSTVVGTLLRVVYDTLFWGIDLPVGGRQQPLLVVLEEAHIFLPKGGSSSAHRTVQRIAKEGRKYGVGLLVVTQRPSQIDATVLSQCGTLAAMRISNAADLATVHSATPDDLGALLGLLPSLRTGEALIVGEAVQIPTRVRFRAASWKRGGTDPNMPTAWQAPATPPANHYAQAIKNWRAQSLTTEEEAT